MLSPAARRRKPGSKSVLRRPGGCYRLFGSAARGAMRPDSDVDLLADFPRLSVAAAIRAAEDACGELGLACDIVDRAQCSETFLKRVLPGAKVLA